uniref:Large ribosomal subunit protein uL4c n=1 Tax=Caloglossa intermedia TaxID=100879 RepID=A0A1Z1M6K3_9FLOR|nr:ribosomal protein L4 [Caloglossa intermedia]ARW61493.1 ribosomal protein L4 [Caloglossa intermedia]
MKEDYFHFHFKEEKDRAMHIIHRAITHHLKASRQGNANTKTRSEVRGGGRKPWKQKGTGRARAGSIRSPLWKGGGVIFGPRSKNYTNKINKKERRLAIKTLISNKTNYIQIIDQVNDIIEKPNTQHILKKLENFNVNIKTREIKFLIIIENDNRNLYFSVRNLPNVELINANNINVISLIKANNIITTTKAIDMINKKYNDQ